MNHILVSACLCGKDCKWDGGNNRNQRLLDYMQAMKGKAAEVLTKNGIRVIGESEI